MNQFKRGNMNPILSQFDINEQIQKSNQQNMMNFRELSLKKQNNSQMQQIPLVIQHPTFQDPKFLNNQLKKEATNNFDPSQLLYKVQIALTKASDNQQLPQYYGRIKKKSRIMKLYKERFIFIHNGYIGYVKSRENQDTKFQQNHQASNKQDLYNYNVTWKQFKQGFSQSMLNFVKIEDIKIEELSIKKSNMYYFEIYFPTSKLVNEQKNIEVMNYQQLESEYVSEQQGQAQNNEKLTKESPNTTIWYFQAHTQNQLNEIKKHINDTKNPPNQQQNKEAEKKVRDLEKEQREKSEQYKRNQEEGLKILKEERRKMEEDEKMRKEQHEKELAEKEKKKIEQLLLQKEQEELELKKKQHFIEVSQKIKKQEKNRKYHGTINGLSQLKKMFTKQFKYKKSQLSFVETCKNSLKEIIFNKALKEDLQQLIPLPISQIKQFDPQLAQLCAQKDTFVKVYYTQHTLFKVVFTSPNFSSQMIENVIKSFKQEFKNYNQLNDDIFEILKYNDYFQLRAPQCCFLEYVGVIALCVANENINMKYLTKYDKISSLQFEEKVKLKEELNPLYQRQRQFSQKEFQKSQYENDQKQKDQMKQTQKINDQSEEKKYENILKQMMKDDYNFSLSDENQNQFIRLQTDESQDPEEERAKVVDVQHIISDLSYHQRHNNRKVVLEQDCSNFILYELNDNLYDTYKKFNELYGVISLHPKHTKIIVVQFKLSMNSQMKSFYLIPEKKEIENTFSFNVNNLQNSSSFGLLKSSENKSQKSQQSLSQLISNHLQQSTQLDSQNPMERTQKELFMRKFISDLQELQISPVEPQQFRKELKKYGIKCSELIDILPIINKLIQGSQHAYVQVLCRIIKKQFRQYMNGKLIEFQLQQQNLELMLLKTQDSIQKIQDHKKILEEQIILIQDEEKFLQGQISMIKDEWEGDNKIFIDQLEELKQIKLNKEQEIQILEKQLSQEQKQIKSIQFGDPEEIQVSSPSKDYQTKNLLQNSSDSDKKQQNPIFLYAQSITSQNSPLQMRSSSGKISQNSPIKSNQLYSMTFSLKEIDDNNLSSIRKKFDMFLIESIRSFVKQIYYDYNQQSPEQSYWNVIIDPIKQKCNGFNLQKEYIPEGVFYQEICKQIGIISKPTEEIKLFDFLNSQSIIKLTPYSKFKKYEMKSSTINSLDNEFEMNLNQHLFMVTQSTIEIKYKILQVYQEVKDEQNNKQEESAKDNQQLQQSPLKIQSSSKSNQDSYTLRQLEQQILLWEMKQLFEEHSYQNVIDFHPRIIEQFYPLQIEKYEPLVLILQSYINIGNITQAEEIFCQIRQLIDYNYDVPLNKLYQIQIQTVNPPLFIQIQTDIQQFWVFFDDSRKFGVCISTELILEHLQHMRK